MPFGEYKDFADCVSQNQDKDSPEGYCAIIHKNITGKYPNESIDEMIDRVLEGSDPNEIITTEAIDSKVLRVYIQNKVDNSELSEDNTGYVITVSDKIGRVNIHVDDSLDPDTAKVRWVSKMSGRTIDNVPLKSLDDDSKKISTKILDTVRKVIKEFITKNK